MCVSFFVCFPPLLNSSVPHLRIFQAILCVYVRGGGPVREVKGLPHSQGVIFLSTLCSPLPSRSLPSPPISTMVLNGEERGNKMLWPSKTQNFCAVTWEVFSAV